MKKSIFLALMFTGWLALPSCQKDKTKTIADAEVNESVEMTTADDAFDEVEEIADQAWDQALQTMKSTEDDRPRLGDCVTITLDTISVPRVLTIDFGEVNCLCNDGKYRRGQIIVTFTGRYRRPGAVITHTFQNYYVNDNHVEGTKVMTNLGFNDSGYMIFHHEASGSITFVADGKVLNWTSDKTRSWIEGIGTPRWRDDVFLVEGTSTASSSIGGSVTRLITNPLRREMNCRWLVSGTIVTTPANRPERTLDFGDGSCDNLATLTIGDQTRTIILR